MKDYQIRKDREIIISSLRAIESSLNNLEEELSKYDKLKSWLNGKMIRKKKYVDVQEVILFLINK